MSMITENAEKIRKYYTDMARGYRMQDTLNQKGRGLPIIPRLSKETHQTLAYPQSIHDITVKKAEH